MMLIFRKNLWLILGIFTLYFLVVIFDARARFVRATLDPSIVRTAETGKNLAVSNILSDPYILHTSPDPVIPGANPLCTVTSTFPRVSAAPTQAAMGGLVKTWYTAVNYPFTPNQVVGITYGESLDGYNWYVLEAPNGLSNIQVLQPSPGGWDPASVETASVVKYGNTYYMYYSAEIAPVGRNVFGIGLATSPDGQNWTKYGSGPIFTGINSWEIPTCTNPNDPSTCVDGGVLEPSVFIDTNAGVIKMWYVGFGKVNGVQAFRIGFAISYDGVYWERHPYPVLTVGANGAWDDVLVSHVNVAPDPRKGYHMFYFGVGTWDNAAAQQKGSIGYAYSVDGISWQKKATPVLAPRPGQWDSWTVAGPAVIIKNNKMYLWYHGNSNKLSYEGYFGLATSACTGS